MIYKGYTAHIEFIEDAGLFHGEVIDTKDVITFTKTTDDDFSKYPERYNEFEVNPSAIFAGYQVGEWHYIITEQQTGTVLEYGKLYLDRGTDFSFTKYDNATTFKTYNG